MTTLKALWKNDSGATALEYGLIAALVSVAAIAAWQTLGTSLTSTVDTVNTELSGS